MMCPLWIHFYMLGKLKRSLVHHIMHSIATWYLWNNMFLKNKAGIQFSRVLVNMGFRLWWPFKAQCRWRNTLNVICRIAFELVSAGLSKNIFKLFVTKPLNFILQKNNFHIILAFLFIKNKFFKRCKKSWLRHAAFSLKGKGRWG